MKNYIFSSTTDLAKILMPVVLLMGCAVAQIDTEPPLDPIPVACPNRFEEMPRDCRDGLDSVCRYDSTGQISPDRSDTAYKCAKVQCMGPDCNYWIALEETE